MFQDDFDVSDGAKLAPGTTLPAELFASDGSRWTNVQNTHPGENSMQWADGALRFVALGRSGNEASKADIIKDGLSFGLGDVVVLAARFRFDGSVVETPRTSTLLDLEDTDELLIDGRATGAGLRVWVDDQGRLGLERGELLPADSEAERIPPMRSEATLPTVLG